MREQNIRYGWKTNDFWKKIVKKKKRKKKKIGKNFSVREKHDDRVSSDGGRGHAAGNYGRRRERDRTPNAFPGTLNAAGSSVHRRRRRRSASTVHAELRRLAWYSYYSTIICCYCCCRWYDGLTGRAISADENNSSNPILECTSHCRRSCWCRQSHGSPPVGVRKILPRVFPTEKSSFSHVIVVCIHF